MGMGIIGWIIIGGLAGWVASKIMKTDAQQGIILNIVVGIVGAILAGFLLGVFGVDLDGLALLLTISGKPVVEDSVEVQSNAMVLGRGA